MSSTRHKKSITVLSSDDTRQWHSPFSKTLREIHQAKIVHNCIETVRKAGFDRYEIYDAYETLIASGVVLPSTVTD